MTSDSTCKLKYSILLISIAKAKIVSYPDFGLKNYAIRNFQLLRIEPETCDVGSRLILTSSKDFPDTLTVFSFREFLGNHR